jgi:hypothetical protein
MAEEIAELADDIGFPVETLRAMLPRDNPFVDRLVEMGYNEESANDVSFIGDLRNVIILMRSHGVSARTAANLLRQTPESPFDSTEETETNSSSSSSDEASEAKRARIDPDYCPSTATTSPSTTAGHSQTTSEQEDEDDSDESDTETTESWNPSETTSPEVYSSPEDD